MNINTLPQAGFGLGLRPQHYPFIFEHSPRIDWFEIISENFMDTGGRAKRNLARILEHYPVVMHGVSLSIGTVDPLNSEYLRKLKALIKFANPMWVSDHLCWTGVAHRNTHDLLPVPYTEQALKHVVQRIREVQDCLERPIALENPSTYLEFNSSSMPEAEFIARMVDASGCHLLLDVNNVYVTCFNHRLDAKAYLDTMPLERVIQIHLAGHSHKGTHIIDTHDDHVTDEVWQLYQYVLQRAGRVPNTMIEWDDHIPDFPVLQAELDKAKNIASSAIDAPEKVSPHWQSFLRGRKDAEHRDETGATELGNVQQHMFRAIVAGPAVDSAPARWIRSKERFPPQEQLDVYINAYRWRLQEVVSEDYPVLAHYLGKDHFDELINAFIACEIPEHFNIGRFALKLPTFTRHYFPDDLFAHELCDLETVLAQIADADETPMLDVASMTELTADAFMSAIIRPRRALQLMAFRFAVNDYYQQVRKEEVAPHPVKQHSYLVVFRHEDQVWRMPLDTQEHDLLQQLFAGVSVARAVDSLAATGAADLLTQLPIWFARWARNGVLTDIELVGTQSVELAS